MLGGAGSPAAAVAEDCLTVTVVRDEHGYGMKVSGDNPVYVQSVKEHGAAWRAGLRAGDRILRVDSIPVHHHTHQQVVHMIRANPTTVLTVQQNTSRHKTPITAPVPVNLEKQRQLEVSKVHTVRLMLDKEQKFIRDLRNEISKVPDVRKQAELQSAEQRCSKLQHEIDTIMAGQPMEGAPSTPRLMGRKPPDKSSSPLPNTGFLSGLPRSLSNLTGQSLRNLRQARNKTCQENTPPLVRQNSDESNNKRRHVHNNTVPMVPTTCLDNVTPPPLPPRSIERPKRNPLSPPPMNPLALPSKPSNSSSPAHKHYKGRYYSDKFPMHQSMPGYNDEQKQFRRSSHSLDGELEGPQPNSIALQMSYPLVNVPPPPLQTDNRTGVPVLHMRSRSSPEQLDHDLARSVCGPLLGASSSPLCGVGAASVSHLGAVSPSVGGAGGAGGAGSPLHKEWCERDTPPPGTPPPPYHTNTQPCSDPQRAIISMEEDDSPASDNSTYSGLFSNLRTVRESKARTAVLLNWLLGERRCACACLLLVLTDGYRSASGVHAHTLRRWAYEIHSTFLVPNAVLQLSGVDENMANEIEHVLVNEYEKEELLRNVFRKARQKAKDELSQQLTEFQVKRQVGLGTLYGPDDYVIVKCDADKAQELVVVEQLLCTQLRCMTSPTPPHPHSHHDPQHTLLAALIAAALALHCRPASVAAAVGGSRASFLQRDKLYKQRVKQITKQHQQPFVVRGHHLQLQALTSVAHCHHCDNIIWGLAPQAYVCTDCKLRVHRSCARSVEEGCCLDGEHHNNRISRFMERIHHNNQPNNLDSNDKKSRKASGTGHFLNMERSFRKTEDEPPWDQTLTPSVIGESRREGSTDEPTAPDADVDTSDANTKESDKDNKSSWRSPGGRGVNRAESCRERDAPRRGKHRNASDPNRLTAHNNHDLEPGAATAPSGSSSSSSLSSRSNESNTVAAEHQASQSDWSEDDEPLAAQWSDSLPPQVLESLVLCPKVRKRQEVIHELIVSERSHIRWLRVLGNVFLKPLETNGLLGQDELRTLFPNLPAVRDHHVRLYTDLKTARSEATNHVVEIRPIADALLSTLGEAGYASSVSKFCRQQRMALDALRERRRKSKELQQFLASREQLQVCGRLQLKDMLACVWQRLTKYQLLLEGILKTADSDGEKTEDISRLRKAHLVAKDVLHTVDTAIRTAENEHRLRTIQSKLEVRIPSASSGEWDDLRRMDLTQHALRYEGELTLRNDSTKRINVLALMLEESLVLLQREGDKFLLKPIPHPNQHQPLSPLIKWDKVLFRPNAAVRNTFFLMNINGVQMHELSANTAPEYASWVKHIQEAPLAKLTELKSTITPSHQASRSNDDSGVNVSRNPSDASEKSSSTVPLDEPVEPERQVDRTSAEMDEKERDSNSVDRDDRSSVDRDDDKEEKHTVRRPTVGRISTHGSHVVPLEAPDAITVSEPAAQSAATALRAFTQHEHLRRLDEIINRALVAKSQIVGEVLGVPPHSYNHLADIAVADALGQVDVSGDLVLSRGALSRSSSTEDETMTSQPDIYQLLFAAHVQATQLTRHIQGALAVSEADRVAARARSGRCDHCRTANTNNVGIQQESFEVVSHPDELMDVEPVERQNVTDVLERDVREVLSHLELQDGSHTEDHVEDALECTGSAALLASRLCPVSSGLRATLSRLLAAAPAPQTTRALRERLAVLREQNDALRTRHEHENQTPEDVSFPKTNLDPSIQEQPSNGG